jgi:GxxExxY protein
MSKLVLEEETYQILGACIKVHKTLGNGFSESVYREALAKELATSEIPFEQEKKLPVFYKGAPLNNYLVADFVCFDKIILDIKSLGFLDQNIKQQALKLLKSTNLEIGYLVNFGENNLTWKRYINT